MLEVGSGLYGLTDLVPELRGQIKLTDAVAVLVEAHRATNPWSNMVVADVQRLPYGASFFDAIVGYDVFDTLDDLDGAVAECARVIRSGGRLVAVLDMMADSDQLIAAFRGSEYLLLPAATERHGRLHFDGVQAVDAVEFDLMRHHYSETGRQFALEFAREPARIFDSTVSVAAKSTVERESGLIPFRSKKTVTVNEFFQWRIEKSLSEHGFRIVSSGLRMTKGPAPEAARRRYLDQHIYYRVGSLSASPAKGNVPQLETAVLVVIGERLR